METTVGHTAGTSWVQPDNKIIQIAGIGEASNVNKFAVIRYKNTGSLDSTFGTNRFLLPVGSNDSYPPGRRNQADGKGGGGVL